MPGQLNPDPRVLRMGVPRRSLSVPAVALPLIALLMTVAALRLTPGFLVPVVLCGLVAVALAPVVGALGRAGVPRAIASGVAVLALLGGIGGFTYAVRDGLTTAVHRLPEATGRLQRELRGLRGQANGPLRALEQAADNIEAVASEAAGRPVGSSSTTPIPALGLRESLVFGTFAMLGLTGSVVMLAIFLYVLLLSGDRLKRKLVRLAGPSVSQRRVAVEIIEGIKRNVRHFLWVVVAMNLLVALMTWASFSLLGIRHAALWGLVAGLLNTVPYLGSAVAAGIFFLAALLQFDELEMAVLTAGVFVVITTIEGAWLKPWLLGRTAHINGVTIFLGLLFWGWAWGVWGLLLAYPIMMVIKTVADHVARLQPLGELLGE